MTILQNPSKRDPRIDALRGLALLMMFCDHIPQNVLNQLTLRNLGFCDAAEVFVLLAGFASMLAYGRVMETVGMGQGLWRLIKRIGRLYCCQVIMFVGCLVQVLSWRLWYPVPVDFLEPELAHGTGSIGSVLSLQSLPGNLNILPLYMVLLAMFPLLWWGARHAMVCTFLLSLALWGLVNWDPRWNFPNGFDPDGWYFDPLAWQFLFFLGMLAATLPNGMPRSKILTGACCTYLVFSALESFPWAHWHLPSLALVGIEHPPKTPLSPWRLFDVLSLFYLVQSNPHTQRLAKTVWGRLLALVGRHSLEVFTLGTILDMTGRLVMTTFSTAWWMQILINLVGLGALVGLAYGVDRKRVAQRSAQLRKSTP